MPVDLSAFSVFCVFVLFFMFCNVAHGITIYNRFSNSTGPVSCFYNRNGFNQTVSCVYNTTDLYNTTIGFNTTDF
jgi:hypothetical protein